MSYKNGFTLAEVLVTMASLGILAAIILPTADKLKPNHEMLMFKKAYYTTARIVQDLINDPNSYPDTDNPLTSGFSNTSHVVSYHGNTYGGTGTDGTQKFCKLFASRLNVVGDIDCSKDGYESELIEDPSPDLFWLNYESKKFNNSFTTSDGIVWGLPSNGFQQSTQSIVVDVNGAKGENCYDNQVEYDINDNKTKAVQTLDCKTPDRFIIKVNREGKVWVDGEIEKAYLKSKSNTKKYKSFNTKT